MDAEKGLLFLSAAVNAAAISETAVASGATKAFIRSVITYEYIYIYIYIYII